jgi:hypothetical protein
MTPAREVMPVEPAGGAGLPLIGGTLSWPEQVSCTLVRSPNYVSHSEKRL